MCSKVIVGFTHEVDSNARCQCFLKLLFHKWISREVDDIINVKGHVYWWFTRDELSDKQTIIMLGLMETNGTEFFCNQMKPVSWGSSEAVECLFEAPVGIWFGYGAVGWGTDNRRFVCR